jgi:ABC-2 type transport system ATP-binding protein
MPAVSFQNVSKTYRSARGELQALKGVSFDIQKPGEFFGLLGPNGAGKTTLISILAGLAQPSGGRVHGPGARRPDRVRRRPPGPGRRAAGTGVRPLLQCARGTALPVGYFGIRHNDDWIDELLAGLGLSDKAGANMRQLSGGMKRRVLVAQALVHKPPVIVLDEPTAGVDVELRQTLWQFISQLNKQRAAPCCSPPTTWKKPRRCAVASPCCSRGSWWRWRRHPICSAEPRRMCLRFKTDDALPPVLAAQARVTGRVVQLPAHHAVEVERWLALAGSRACGPRMWRSARPIWKTCSSM